ncbi:MAG: hypothetical protein KatS3mg077_1423 [Candidatus Binatia bacterium]|nr:MAG: hypothetical protein KatS3mg077_1423 [Candidatus Binatia bacterium]
MAETYAHSSGRRRKMYAVRPTTRPRILAAFLAASAISALPPTAGRRSVLRDRRIYPSGATEY